MLSRLPPDILGLILSNPSSSYHILHLWSTGDKILAAKLRVCITHVSLRFDKVPLLRLPHVLFELKNLRYLSLYCIGNLMKNPADWSAELTQLPKTLNTLCIETKDAAISLLNFAPDSTTTSPQYITTVYPRGSSRFIDLDTILPSLLTLKLESSDRVRLATMKDFDFAGLPSSLTSLETHVLLTPGMAHKPSSLAELPRSIRKLVGVDAYEHDTLRDWPPHLETLEWSHPIPETTSTTHWLPRSLTKTNSNSFFTRWNADMSLWLPPLLQTLSLDPFRAFQSIGSSWIASLPRHLTSLFLVDHTDSLNTSFLFPLADLPPGLTELVSLVAFQGWDDVKRQLEATATRSESDSLWPPNLKNLTLRGTRLSPAQFKLLPSKLTTLQISIEDDQYRYGNPNDGLDLNALFPNLTFLHLETFDHLYVQHRLPSNLRDLTLLRQDREEPFSGAEEPFSGAEEVPDLDICFTRNLPTSITECYVSEWHCDLLSYFPPNITTLAIGDLIGLEKSELVAQGRLFERLPTSLTCLEIYNEKDEDEFEIPVQDCSASFERLRVLIINQPVSPKILRFLPRDMRHLTLKLLTLDEDASFLPPGLQTIALGTIVDPKAEHIAPHWPKKLRKLN